MRKGAWAVRRFSLGVREDDTWDQDGSGWTRCYLNKEPTLEIACRAFGGLESTICVCRNKCRNPGKRAGLRG